MADMQTPLARVRGRGSAQSGTKEFWMQRATAIANVPLTLFLVVGLVVQVGASHAEVVAFLEQPVVGVAMLLLILSACYHMQLGLQVVIEDYVREEFLKLAAVLANYFFTVAVGLAGSVAVLKLVVAG